MQPTPTGPGWMWDYPSAEIVDFSTARGIDRLYLSAPPGFSSVSSYHVFLNLAHDSSIEVFALAGDPQWAKRSSSFIKWVDEVVAHGGFDGLVPDVEPYALPEWNNEKRRDLLISKSESFGRGDGPCRGSSGDLGRSVLVGRA